MVVGHVSARGVFSSVLLSRFDDSRHSYLMDSETVPDLHSLLAAESSWLQGLARSLLADHAEAADVAQDAAQLGVSGSLRA